MQITLLPIVGDFGEDKDAAATLRDAEIRPHINRGETVIIDFNGVTLVTQSFIHALISDILRIAGEDALGLIEFKNCVELVQGIISTVVQYSLDTLTDYNAVEIELEQDEFEKQQSFAFMKTARALECDESEEHFNEALGKIVRQRTNPPRALIAIESKGQIVPFPREDYSTGLSFGSAIGDKKSDK